MVLILRINLGLFGCRARGLAGFFNTAYDDGARGFGALGRKAVVALFWFRTGRLGLLVANYPTAGGNRWLTRLSPDVTDLVARILLLPISNLTSGEYCFISGSFSR
ncbi:hypothetical protein [Paractinoplanes atraurantiacus]|uniref:hypothetical protein n=1 Tax=Paractinoplanes atraurantiacus TaxID=1036182 RepID=UPI0011775360|nr:hypothetical protein [Actinoplanes atraurantiacus]